MKSLLHKRKKNTPQIVLTNLIDVMFMMVFFFMLTSTFAKENEKLSVTLPKAANSVTIEQNSMTIEIAQSGQISVQGINVNFEELENLLGNWLKPANDRAVMLAADENANYGTIINVLDLAKKHGASNLGLTTRQAN